MVSTALVAIFVDMENVGGQFIRSVADFGATQGRVCHLAVYGDWRRGYGQHWDTTLDVGGVPTQILRTGGKNSADIAIVVDVMEFLSLTPTVQVYVLATGDSDFVPLAQKLRSRGKVVIGVAPKGRSVADTLIAACDRFERLDYDKSVLEKPAAGPAGATAAVVKPPAATAPAANSTAPAPAPAPATPAKTPAVKPVPAGKSAPAKAAGAGPAAAATAEAPAKGKPEPEAVAVAPTPPVPPARTPSHRTPTIEQVRAALMEMLERRGPMTTGAIGSLLQQAMPGFRHRSLGHRTLSDLLRAQTDLLDVVPTAHELRVTLRRGVRRPEGEYAEPYDPQDLIEDDLPWDAEPWQPTDDPVDEMEEFFPTLPEPPQELPRAAPAGVLWPALLRHLGGIDLAARPEARSVLACSALQSLAADGRGEAARQIAMNAGIPLPARRAYWLAECASALHQLGGEDAVLDRMERLDPSAKRALLQTLPGVGPATAEAVLAAVEPIVDRPPPQNLLLF